MSPMDFVVCHSSWGFCDLSFMVVSIFSYGFNRSRVKFCMSAPACLWKTKSETEANAPLTMCSSQQIPPLIPKTTYPNQNNYHECKDVSPTVEKTSVSFLPDM